VKEEWRRIKDRPHEISNLGRLRRVETPSGKPCCKILRPHPKPDGYIQTHLMKNRREMSPYLHLLVAEYFLPPKPTKEHEANHKDGVKWNNKASNLEWMTKSENILHAFKLGLGFRAKGEKNGNSKLRSEDVLKIKERLSNGETVKKVASDFDIPIHTIYDIRSGKTWKHI
jgi:hypothetical protein